MQNQNVNPDFKPARSQKVALVFIILFLSIQITVPVAKLLSPRPARFGWHMWTIIPPRRDVVLLMRDGSSQPADLRPYLAQARGELDLDDILPPHLCQMMPDVAAVRYRSDRMATTQIHTCR